MTLGLSRNVLSCNIAQTVKFENITYDLIAQTVKFENINLCPYVYQGTFCPVT